MKFTPEQIAEALASHSRWLANETGKRLEIHGDELQCADLQGADLQDADLRDANLQYADLRNANLQNADLRNANLRNANLQYAILYGVYLQNADLQNADLQYADLQYANLQYAILYGVDLHNANLHNADLQNANLQDADLQNANLRDANFRLADLSGAKLSFKDIESALAELPNLKHAPTYGVVFTGTKPDSKTSTEASIDTESKQHPEDPNATDFPPDEIDAAVINNLLNALCNFTTSATALSPRSRQVLRNRMKEIENDLKVQDEIHENSIRKD